MTDNSGDSKGFFLYLNQADALLHLPPETAMKVLRACRDFHAGEDVDLSDPVVACMFELMRPIFEAAQTKSQNRREAGRKGGMAKTANAKQETTDDSKTEQAEPDESKDKQNVANSSKGKQTLAKPSYKQEQEQEQESFNITSPSGEVVGVTAPTPAQEAPPLPAQRASPPPCPHGEIVELYHATLPELPRVDSMSETRKGHLQARWRERLAKHDYGDKQGGLAWWNRFFLRVRDCPWLMGQVTARDGKVFRADLAWLIRPENFLKTLEGKYDRREGERVKSWQERESDANTAAFLAMN